MQQLELGERLQHAQVEGRAADAATGKGEARQPCLVGRVEGVARGRVDLALQRLGTGAVDLGHLGAEQVRKRGSGLFVQALRNPSLIVDILARPKESEPLDGVYRIAVDDTRYGSAVCPGDLELELEGRHVVGRDRVSALPEQVLDFGHVRTGAGCMLGRHRFVLLAGCVTSSRGASS